jgi:PAS domain-containing protein
MGIFLVDEQKLCVFMVDTAEDLTGYLLEKAIGRPLH